MSNSSEELRQQHVLQKKSMSLQLFAILLGGRDTEGCKSIFSKTVSSKKGHSTIAAILLALQENDAAVSKNLIE